MNLPTPRLAVASLQEMRLACLAVGTGQLLLALRFCLRLLLEKDPPSGGAPLPVSVIVPVKGAPEGLERTVDSLLAQELPEGSELLFVVPSEEDPAHGRLKALLASRPGGDKTCLAARLLVSGAKPTRCSEKILNVLHAYSRIAPGPRVVLFADGDLVFPRGWAAAMAAALRDPEVGVATTHALVDLGLQRGFWGWLRHVWEVVGVPYLEASGSLSGNSLAFRREDFESMGVARAWEKSICTDFVLKALVRRSGRKVRFVCRAMPIAEETCGLDGLLSLTGKWMFYFRVYSPVIWLLGALLTVFKLAVPLWTLYRWRWSPLAMLVGLDAAWIVLLVSFMARRLPGASGRPRGPLSPAGLALAVLAAPVLPFLYASNYLSSMRSREVVWGGYRYRISAPDRVEVVS